MSSVPTTPLIRTMGERIFSRCLNHALGKATYLDVDISTMPRGSLMAVIGHMALEIEKLKHQRSDYIHSSAVSAPSGGITPRSPIIR